ncbi:MAG TPA: alcohol dehydrogenase catalytic domain-containing protein [Chloroflexota bacterium]|jgi:threonine dehydrogenase-like Zn-dependent dehydrogenase|nr:alcohol dehydrogenase catalytic domain-containing protein [Chloroflexota bacterium]
MNVAQISEPGALRLLQADDPIPGREQVLLKVLACGICGSDLNAWRGVPGIEYPLAPGLPGHEVWGEIVELGPGVDPSFGLLPGRKVTGLVQAGFAQYAATRADELMVIPANMGDSPLLGEPLACAANIVRRMQWRDNDILAVVGFGYIAALVVLLLYAERPGRWVAISRRPESRALAMTLGARAAVDFHEVPTDWWDKHSVVLECAGVQQTLDYATWLTAYGGRLVVAGYHADGPRTINMQNWNWKGIDVVNAHERQPRAYLQGLSEGLRLVGNYNINLGRLLSHRWRLDELELAFRTAIDRPPGYVKGLVLPWSA